MHIPWPILFIACYAQNNFTFLPIDAMMNIMEYLPRRKQYNMLSLHSKLDTAFWSARQDEIAQMQPLLNIIKIATENDLLFDECKERIKRISDQLSTNLNDAFIDELPRTLSLARNSNISDANKLILLEYLTVYSPCKTSLYNPVFFFPELWINYQSYAYFHGPCSIMFDKLPQTNRMLIMSSRIITQSIYPFVTEIATLGTYVADYLSSRIASRMIYSLHRTLQRYATLPSISLLYHKMSRMDPLIYFAALYFEELFDKFQQSFGFETSRTNSAFVEMKTFNFIQWNPPIIKKIKQQYFKTWKANLNVQKGHRYDILTYHEMYAQILELSGIYEMSNFNPLRIKISTIALLETFDACFEDKECDVTEYEYLTKDIILMHGLDNYHNGEMDLCKKLMHVFSRICDKNALLWIIKWEHPYYNSVFHRIMGYSAIKQLSRFKVWCICYLRGLRDEWVLWKLKVHAAFCKIDYEIVKGLKARGVI